MLRPIPGSGRHHRWIDARRRVCRGCWQLPLRPDESRRSLVTTAGKGVTDTVLVILKRSRQTSRGVSSDSANSLSSQAASCLGTVTAIVPRSSISQKARSSNMPVTARFPFCTKLARYGQRPAAPPIGGRTWETRPLCCLWATCCTTRAITTCDARFGVVRIARDARSLNCFSRRTEDSEKRTQYLRKGDGCGCRSLFRSAAAHDRDRFDCLSDGRRFVCDPSHPTVPGACLSGHAGGHGLCRQLEHHGHGGRGTSGLAV